MGRAVMTDAYPSIDRWIEAVSEANPGSVALIDADGKRWTFEELSTRKRQYIGLFADKAVGPGDCVGLNGTASAEYVSAALALMHMGAVVVPLSPDLPPRYRRDLIERAGATMVLADTSDFPDSHPWISELEQQPDPLEVPCFSGAETPFLLMFTSGSSGSPKGVLHCHRQPVNRFRWMIKAFPPSEDEVCAARPTVSIMPSLWEIFGGLAMGTPTLFIGGQDLHDPARWLRRLAAFSVTRITVTPDLLRILLTEIDHPGMAVVPPLRVVTVGGTTLPDRVVDLSRRLLPDAQLLEDYGATEANTIAAGLRVSSGEPLFYPIDGVRVAILDEHGERVPDGEEGELCVAGEGVALGYWQDESLNETRFCEIESLGRAYRTGDRARMLEDGGFLLLGRARDQVKLNGLVLDLEAVERALREVPGVVGAAAAVSEHGDAEAWSELHAAVVADHPLDLRNVRRFVSDVLPRHMVPSRLVQVKALPKLPTGKLDRDALERILASGHMDNGVSSESSSAGDAMRAAYQAVTGRPLTEEHYQETWDLLGLNSLSTVAMAQELSARLGVALSATEFFDYVTPGRLLEHLTTLRPLPEPAATASTHDAERGGLAITGMSARVPGADSLDALWQMVRHGAVAEASVPLGRWPLESPDDSELSGAFLGEDLGLNARLYGMSPEEALRMDPQLRVMLSGVRQCLDDAAISRESLRGRSVGVFVACRPSGFAALENDVSVSRSPEAFLGSDEAILAGRIAHWLNVKGPAMTVNTTCSSGITALHLARHSIESGECESALVVAACVMSDPEFLRKTSMLGVTSRDGRCRPFDAAASGFVPAEGSACIYLERPGDADAAGREPWATVVDSRLNHDGLSKSLTSPNGASQAMLLNQIYGANPVALERLAYIETHGTGTALGDPVEVKALLRLEGRTGPVTLGSLKANIGHANAAAGLLGVIKTALCMHRRELPPLAGFNTANPAITEEALESFVFPRRATDWPTSKPYAGVSAFGMSGTNAHTILRMEPARQSAPEERNAAAETIHLSAADDAALRSYAGDLAHALEQSTTLSLSGISTTLNRRSREREAVTLLVGSVQDLIEQLHLIESQGAHHQHVDGPWPAAPSSGASVVHLPVSGEGTAASNGWRNSGGGRCVWEAARGSNGGLSTVLERLCARCVGDQDWEASAETPLRDLGLDSIRAVSLKDSLQEQYGSSPSLFELQETASLASLQRTLAPGSEAARSNEAFLEQDRPRMRLVDADSAPLTDLQSVYLAAKMQRGPVEQRVGAWNVMFIDPGVRLDEDRLSSAWNRVTERHGMLRARVTRLGRQYIAMPESHSVPVIRPVHSEESLVAEMLAEAAGWAEGPMATLRILRGPTTDKLVVGVDSFVADAMSTHIALGDLWSAYDGAELGPDIPDGAFFGIRCDQESVRNDDARRAALKYWDGRISGCRPATVEALRVARASDAESQGWMRLSYRLTAAQRTVLEAKAQRIGVPVLTYLCGIFREWCANRSREQILVALTVTDRPHEWEDIDSVVGPFTEMMLHPIEIGARATAAWELQEELDRDLTYRSMTGTEILRERSIDPPQVVYSSVTQRARGRGYPVSRSLSVTSGVQIHAHATREASGEVLLDWDVDTQALGDEGARELFDEYRELVAQCLTDGPSVSEGQARATVSDGSDASLTRVPLTRAMRSYQAQRALARDNAVAYAVRVYAIDADQLPVVFARWRALFLHHEALHTVQTPHGQFRLSGRALSPAVTRYEASIASKLDDWLSQVEEWEAAALAQSAWPPVRLSVGTRGELNYLFIAFNCHSLDAVSTLLVSRLLLSATSDTDLDRERDDALQYATWQKDHSATNGGEKYWRARLERLSGALPRSSSSTPGYGETRVYSLDFSVPAGQTRTDSAALVAWAFRRGLKSVAELSHHPTICIDYVDRTERPSWEVALGDFSTFGFLLPGAEYESLESVKAQRRDDVENRRTDWFPLTHEYLGASVTPFRTAFTDALSCQRSNAVPEMTATHTAAYTAGVVVDCLVYGAGGRVTAELCVGIAQMNAKETEEMLKSFKAALDSQGMRAIEQNASEADVDAEEFQTRQNRTSAPFERDATIVQLFDRAAKTWPSSVAVTDDHEKWTYAELSDRVDAYARALSQGHGIGRGDVVAVRMKRDRRQPAVLLAVMRLGAAFVPLNHGEPTERHNKIIERSQARLTVLAVPDEQVTGESVTVAELEDPLARANTAVPDASTAESLAYIVFTSGSTGSPKGVMVRHRPVVNLFQDLVPRFGIGPQDKGAWVNAAGFDLTIFDLFGLLAAGATIRVVNEVDRLDPRRIARILASEGITFWNSAPVFFQPVLEQIIGLRLVHQCRLRLVFLSGDWIPLELARRCLAEVPQTQVVALGGATEAVVWSNLHLITQVSSDWRSIPYGRPIQNAEYWVLDESMQPQPPGVPGDLYIGGECLSDGYVNDPEQTRAAFVPDPRDENRKIYRTGDRARFMDNGEIEFLGRSDRQVKVRGHRIELGEVERAMAEAGFVAPVALATDGGQANAMKRSLVGFCTGTRNRRAQERLEHLLPAHMIPSRITVVDGYPTTVNGKLDNTALLLMVDQHPLSPAGSEGGNSRDENDGASIESWLLDFVSDVLECSVEDLDTSLGLGHQGFNSLHYALLANQICDSFACDVTTAQLLPLASLDEVIEFVSGVVGDDVSPSRGDVQAEASPSQSAPASHKVRLEGASRSGEDALRDGVNERLGAGSPPSTTATEDLVAVVGLYARMPEANSAEQYWINLVEGRDCVVEVPEDRWDWQAVYGDEAGRDLTTSRWGGFLSDVDRFDADRFRVSPREAEMMDPRQRLALSGVWQLMEDSGYSPVTTTPQSVGLFLGVTGDEYGALLAERGAAQDQLSLIGTGRSIIANRVNYTLNWSGPSEVIDTTCSSSLVAIHHAVSALQRGDCAMAVAGGVSVLIDPRPHIALSKVGVLAADGRCKTFDARADGYVRSEGIGLVLLKPLSAALADGDQVKAVVRACRINHGGRSSALTAPNVAAQTNLIEQALEEAGPGVAGLGLHESHGTGTGLGDPIELDAFQRALRTQLEREGMDCPPSPVSVGSVKSAIGHAEAAAGVAGFIKAVLALQNREIPPLVHLQTVNPQIDLDPSLIHLGGQRLDWSGPAINEGAGLTRRATVSAFGFGGVNAFAVLEEAPACEPRQERNATEFFVLSARTDSDLNWYANSLASWLEDEGRDVPLADVAFTLRWGRVQDSRRAAIVASTRDELVSALRSVNGGAVGQGSEPLDVALRSGSVERIAEAWQVSAETADWSQLSTRPSSQPRRARLPLSRFRPQRFWHSALERVPSSRRCRWRPLEFASGEQILRVTARDGFLAEHSVAGEPVLPGAAWIVAAAQVLHASSDVSLRNVVLQAPLTLQGEPAADVLVERDDDRIGFRRRVDGAPTLCSMRVDRSRLNDEPPLTAYRRTFSRHYSTDECKREFEGKRIDYGPLFQVIKDLWVSSDEALAHVRLNEHAAVEDRELSIPIVDALFQVVMLFEAFNGREGTRVPVFAEVVELHRAPTREGFVRVTEAAEETRHDVWLFDDAGNLCVALKGVRGQELSGGVDETDGFVGLEPAWRDSRLDHAGRGGMGQKEALPSRPEGGLSGVASWVRESDSGLTLRVSLEKGPQEVLLDCMTAVQEVYRGMGGMEPGSVRTMVLVVPEAQPDAEIVASGLAGLVETLRVEVPGVSAAVLLSPPEWSWCSATLHASRAGGLYRVRSGVLQEQVLEPVQIPRLESEQRLLGGGAEGGGFVLVTGGAGFIGSHLCDRLVDDGATVLAIGRAEDRSDLLSDSVYYQQVDVKDMSALRRCLDHWRSKLGPVRAVYHLAGTEPGGLFVACDVHELKGQVEVKLGGLINLDLATRVDAPGVFVAFSSVAAHAGAVGCAAYAAANRAVEAYIAKRSRAQTGRSISIAWSAWPEGGMSFQGRKALEVEAEGIRPVPHDAAHSWIECALSMEGVDTLISPFGNTVKVLRKLTAERRS